MQKYVKHISKNTRIFHVSELSIATKRFLIKGVKNEQA